MTWHAVISNPTDRRIVDFDFGLSTQQHLVDTQNEDPTNRQILTFVGDIPSEIGLGYRVNPAGQVAPPTSAELLTNEALAERKEIVEGWVIRNGPTRQFLFYQENIGKRQADAFAAVLAETFYRTLSPTTLGNATHWGRLQAHANIDWDNFVSKCKVSAWFPSGSYEIIEGMKDGTQWKTVGVDTAGLYIPVTDADGANWPAAYTFSETHRTEYTKLIKRVQVL